MSQFQWTPERSKAAILLADGLPQGAAAEGQRQRVDDEDLPGGEGRRQQVEGDTQLVGEGVEAAVEAGDAEPPQEVAHAAQYAQRPLVVVLEVARRHDAHDQHLAVARLCERVATMPQRAGCRQVPRTPLQSGGCSSVAPPQDGCLSNPILRHGTDERRLAITVSRSAMLRLPRVPAWTALVEGNGWPTM